MRQHIRAVVRTYRSYRGTGLGTRAFVAGRLAIAPLRSLAGELADSRGKVLSLGSGIGVVDRYLAEVNAGVEVEGVDLDAGRVEVAAATEALSPRVTATVGDAIDVHRAEGYQVVLACDAIHHIGADSHKALAVAVADSLAPGGVCIVKDLDVAPRWKYEWNRLHDRLVAGPEPIFCRAPGAMAEVLAEAGLVIESMRRIDRRLSPYAHYIVRARKPFVVLD